MKVYELIRELQYFNPDAETSILLPGVINGKNGAAIIRVDKYLEGNDSPGVILITGFHKEPTDNG